MLGGNMQITAADDGMHADSALTITGETYLLTAGNSTQEITMDSLIYGGGGMNGQPGSGMPGQSENGMPGQDRKRNDGVPGQKLFTP